MPDITATWNLGRGDMLYGIGPQISRYLKRLYGGGINPHSYKEDRFAAINTYNTAIRNQDYTLGGTTIAVTNPATPGTAVGNYARALIAHRKYAPSTVGGDISANPRLLASLRKGQDTLLTTSPARVVAATAKELAIRRSCKFGIEYAVGLPAYIHYILDEMDMMKVAGKEMFDKTITVGYGSRARDISFKKMSICTTELRFLFRNWQRIKATNRVLFYWQFQTAPAPWEDNDGYAGSMVLWSDYAAHRVDKAIAKRLKPLDDALAEENSDMGIGFMQLQEEQRPLRAAIKRPYQAFKDSRARNDPAVTQVAAFHAIPSNLVND